MAPHDFDSLERNVLASQSIPDSIHPTRSPTSNRVGDHITAVRKWREMGCHISILCDFSGSGQPVELVNDSLRDGPRHLAVAGLNDIVMTFDFV